MSDWNFNRTFLHSLRKLRRVGVALSLLALSASTAFFGLGIPTPFEQPARAAPQPPPSPAFTPFVVTAFKHIAAPETLRANQTILDHPSLNGRSDLLLFVTADYGSAGPYHEKPVGVWYDGSRWTIFNQDQTPMQPNVRFNVLAIRPSEANNAFMHVARPENTSGHITYLDHPQLNGNPNARLLVTPNWIGTYNNNSIGVWYDGGAGRWSVFNQNFAPMLPNAAFNVLIWEVIFEVTLREDLGVNWFPVQGDTRPETLVFATQNWRGVYNNNEIGVWHDGSRWNIYNQTRQAMRPGMSFFVLMLNPAPPPPAPPEPSPTPPPPAPPAPSPTPLVVTLAPPIPPTPGPLAIEERTVRVVLDGGICPHAPSKAGFSAGRIVRGGRDFNPSLNPFERGAPVRVRGNAELVVNSVGRVELVLDFEAIGNGAHFAERFIVPLRNLDPIPPGATIVPPTVSRFEAALPGAGAELGGCNDGERHEIFVDNGPVSRLIVTGDTGAQDISDDPNCYCDMRIWGIEFRPIQVRFASRAGPSSIPIPRNAVIGWADLHAHPAAHLAFGFSEDPRSRGDDDFAGLFHGRPGLALASSNPLSDLAACNPDKHAGGDGDPIRHATRTKIIEGLENARGFTHGNRGAPTFEHWPHALSRTHQQMHVTMLRRAYEGGMRLMIASVTDNQALNNLWFVGTHLGRGSLPSPDSRIEFDSAVRQIRFINAFARANSDWMEVVTTPQQARRAIREGKLALILGVEMDSLDLQQTLTLIREHGVRSVIPIHIPDNPHFGGAAVYDDTFNALNHYLNGTFFQVVGDPQLSFRLQRPRRLKVMDVGDHIVGGVLGGIAVADIGDDEWNRIGYDRIPNGHRNRRGLTQPQAIEALMAEGILLDVAHMSQQSMEDTLQIAERHGFPLINSHSGLRDHKRQPSPHEVVSERAMRFDHAQRMARLGGVLGLGTAEATAEGWLAAYSEATRVMGTPGRVAFGTDFNGLSPQIVASGGSLMVYPLRYLREVMPGAPRIEQPFTLGSKTFSLSQDGLAHYGMFPELLQRFWDLGTGGQAAVRSLFLSAEYTIQAWERAQAAAGRIARPGTFTRTIRVEPHGEICPSTARGGRLLRGGNDFNGPVTVSGEATVRLERGGRPQLLASLVFTATSRSTTFTQRFELPLSTRDEIPREARIISPATSRFTQTLPGAGPEFAACNDGDRHTIRVDSGPIQSLVVIGDTGSTDIDTSG
ncbi:MAG: membrane dipeptidase, partial [Thermoflexales bacterium]|nr:membrane dipeptidase [Thermoflexales bacterium]